MLDKRAGEDLALEVDVRQEGLYRVERRARDHPDNSHK